MSKLTSIAREKLAMTAKTVLITGATRGIGLALAQEYATRGWKVIGAARDLRSAEQVRAPPHWLLRSLSTMDIYFGY